MHLRGSRMSRHLRATLLLGASCHGALLKPAPARWPALHPPWAERGAPLPANAIDAELASPEGFESEYSLLRSVREQSGRAIMSVEQLRAMGHGPVADRLEQRVDFDAPTTAAEALSKFFGHPTARFIAGALALSVGARCSVGAGFSAVDGGVALATAAFWMVQEHVIHGRLLHCPSAWYGSDVHRWHHELPYFHVSLDGPGLAAAWFASVAALLLGAGALASALPAALTALASYTLCGFAYEASHYLAHTRVPLPPALQRVRRHHMLHHTVSHEHWLAFTLPAVDTLFGTNPDPRDLARRRAVGARDAAAAVSEVGVDDAALAARR